MVDSKAIMALIGTEMNYVEDEIGSQFVFKNPNEKGKCGCGESFHIWFLTFILETVKYKYFPQKLWIIYRDKNCCKY